MPSTMALKPEPCSPSGRVRGASAPRAGRVCLFGAAPDTGNLGVSALCESAVQGIWSRAPQTTVTVFDHGAGDRPWAPAWAPDGSSLIRCGAVHSLRPDRVEGLWRMRASNLAGLRLNPGVRAVRDADAVLDVSGGDSFTDLYGLKRFWTVALPKLIALEAGRPLVLLPQTYGPFRSERSRRIASSIVRRATRAWVRDLESYERLKELAGDTFDPARHRCAVDMAFGLEVRRPEGLTPELAAALSGDRRPIGFNVSGLIYANPGEACSRYGLRADYREAVVRVVRELLKTTDRDIVLVAHVFGRAESDADACRAAVDSIEGPMRSRVHLAPDTLDAGGAKWVLGRCEWVCATRMHACIAALSSGVPAAAIAYSDKTKGVLETCGQGDAVIDPRRASTDEVVDALLQCWQNREEARERLHRALPDVLAQRDAFFDALADVIVPTGADRGAA